VPTFICRTFAVRVATLDGATGFEPELLQLAKATAVAAVVRTVTNLFIVLIT